jgi:hypothetical protein
VEGSCEHGNEPSDSELLGFWTSSHIQYSRKLGNTVFQKDGFVSALR